MQPPPPLSEATSDSRGLSPEEVTIGILAALPVEGAAMARLIDDVRVRNFSRDPNTYRVGSLPSNDLGRSHRVALAVLPRDGTRSAANVCTNLLRTFGNVRCVIMMGIAGGIPRPKSPARHVRLGDIVVATAGIVDYGHVRQTEGLRRPRRSDGHISSALVQAANELQMAESSGECPWESWFDPQSHESAREYPRPDEETDRLFVRGSQVTHPDRAVSGHPRGRPKIHYGAVGSADVLMRDEDERDRLAKEYHDLFAVEMEGSGIAASTSGHDVSWFMVRGVVDYCEMTGKDDVWHRYSSYAAAAYVRALLAACRPFPMVLPLVPPGDNDRLLPLLDRLPEVDLRAVWDGAVPHLPEPPGGVLTSVERAYRYLSNCNADPGGLAPVLAFVDELATRVPDAALAAELYRWVEEQATSMRVGEALARRRARPPTRREGTANPCLLVEITPVAIDREDCEIMSWIQERSGPWRPRPGRGLPQRMALVEAESFVGDLLDRAEQEWREAIDVVTIEFLLPTDLLNLPVEWWRPRSPTYEQAPLCVDYQIMVRSLDRMRRDIRPRLWGTRWSTLLAEPLRMKVYWGEHPQTEEALAAWSMHLRADETMALVVLSTSPEVSPGREELGIALRAGVPVIIWDRRPQRDEGGTQAIANLLGGSPAQLPHRVRSLRTEAAAAGAARCAHPGKRVVLLWDDPSRVIMEWRAENDTSAR